MTAPLDSWSMQTVALVLAVLSYLLLARLAIDLVIERARQQRAGAGTALDYLPLRASGRRVDAAGRARCAGHGVRGCLDLRRACRAGADRSGDGHAPHDGVRRGAWTSIRSTPRVRVGQWLLVAGTLGVSLLNGIDISPAFEFCLVLSGELRARVPALRRRGILLPHLAVDLVADAHHRRHSGGALRAYAGLGSQQPGSLAIWLMAAALLTLPLILRMWALGDE